MPWHVIGRIAIAGLVVPGISWLVLVVAQASGNGMFEDLAFWILAVSYPFWHVLWFVMANPNNTLYFTSLIAISLGLNAALYALVGIAYFLVRRLFSPRATQSP